MRQPWVSQSAGTEKSISAATAAIMANVDEMHVEVVVAHKERATLRVGDVFLKKLTQIKRVLTVFRLVEGIWASAGAVVRMLHDGVEALSIDDEAIIPTWVEMVASLMQR
jgi:hypothetical protein